MYDKFLNQVRVDAYDHANDEEKGGLRQSSLLHIILDRLEEVGVLDDGQVAYYLRETTNLSSEVHAYSYDTDDDILSLYYFIDAYEASSLGDTWTPGSIGKDQIQRGFRRLVSFIKTMAKAKADDLEESQPIAELAKLMHERDGAEIELHIITLGTISDRALSNKEDDGIHREIWDLARLARTCGSGSEDKVEIDFIRDFRQSLPCLITPVAEDGIQVMLSCIPGMILAEIYKTYRSRLLERNVRSFLQFAGKVNKGIRDTVLNSPARFLSYNNGISATASGVSLEEVDGTLARISLIKDFQIVNGGQTTASIATCLRRDRADLSAVLVPMKLTLVPPDKVDELVPLISKYANTQNRIQEADFSANHPWHVELERLSRNTWIPKSEDAPRGTRWYYERSRGQYADELSAESTPAGRRRFRIENPSRQRITKTDLAKFMLSWDQQPSVVSKGAQKCFMYLMSRLCREARPLPDILEFKRIIGMAIIFRNAEKLYSELGYQGYRANIVTYSIARLSYALQRRIDWDSIWARQEVSPELVEPLKKILAKVRDVILNPPANRNITEWCKKEECWSSIISLELDLGLDEIIEKHGVPGTPPIGGTMSAVESPLVRSVMEIPSEVWFAISNWAKETQTLQAWQRGLAYSLGKLGSRQKAPSLKQAKHGRRLLLEARRLGFGHEVLTIDMLEKIAQSDNGQNGN